MRSFGLRKGRARISSGSDENEIRLVVPVASDPEWLNTNRQIRNRYLRQLGPLAARMHGWQCARGLDADGRRLRPVQPESRPDGATGPPLTPHYAASRTRDLLRFRVDPDTGEVVLFWAEDWGTILGYHARELRKRRDVIGLSPGFLSNWEAEAIRVWNQTLRRAKMMQKARGRR